MKLVSDYYRYRNYVQPTLRQAYLWLFTEVVELGVALQDTGSCTFDSEFLRVLSALRQQVSIVLDQEARFVRNNPTGSPQPPDVLGEIGDILMMLERVSTFFEADPLDCLIYKMKSKGFDPNEHL